MIPPHRIEVLTEIATRYQELTDPGAQLGVKGDGDGFPHMPTTYTPTVREFERLMNEMRRHGKQQAYGGHGLHRLVFHLQGYYVYADRVIRLEPVMKPNRNGKLVQLRDHHGNTVLRPTIRYRRHPDAKKDRADLAVGWIAERWGLASEPFLPREVYEVAA